MKLTLKIWRQKNAKNKGKIVEYPIDGISPDMSPINSLAFWQRWNLER